MLNLHDGRGPHEATLRVKQLETVGFIIQKEKLFYQRHLLECWKGIQVPTCDIFSPANKAATRNVQVILHLPSAAKLFANLRTIYLHS